MSLPQAPPTVATGDGAGEVAHSSPSLRSAAPAGHPPVRVLSPRLSSPSPTPSHSPSPTFGTTLQLSPEARARQLISQALREASSGKKALQSVGVVGWMVDESASVALYEIEIRGRNNLRWTLTRRYTEFAALNELLENSVRDPGVLPPFPEKEWTWWGWLGGVDHCSPDFLNMRQSLLDNYLKKVSKHSRLRCGAAFLDFLRPARDDCLDGPPSPPQPQPRALPVDGENSISANAASPSASANNSEDSIADQLYESRSFGEEQKRQEGGSPYPASAESTISPRRQSRSQLYAPSSSDRADIFGSSAAAASSSAPASLPASASSLSSAALAASTPVWVSPEVSSASIPATQCLKNDHVVFQCNLANAARQDDYASWTMLKRFAEFRQLDEQIRLQFAQKYAEDPVTLAARLASLPLLPHRELKVLVDHLQHRFIEKRRLMLEVYLKRIISLEEVATMDCVLDFLGIS